MTIDNKCHKYLFILKKYHQNEGVIVYLMKILFWNTYRNENINSYVLDLVNKYEVDILLLAEYRSDIKKLDLLLKNSNQALVRCNTIGCNRIEIWSNYSDMSSGLQTDYYSLQVVKNELIICGVHLFSNLRGDKSYERLEKAKEIKNDIAELGEVENTKKAVIIGDFNGMPYEEAFLFANGLFGLPVLNQYDKNTKKVNGTEYTKYYNPMWNFFGDFNYPPGTYYSDQSSLNSPMWYIFDQVIMSKEVIPFFKQNKIEIITNGLKDKKGYPNKKISDHFPIVLELEEDIIHE